MRLNYHVALLVYCIYQIYIAFCKFSHIVLNIKYPVLYSRKNAAGPKTIRYYVAELHQFCKLSLVYSKSCILTHLAYIANGKKTCYIVQQFHWANKRDVTLRHL